MTVAENAEAEAKAETEAEPARTVGQRPMAGRDDGDSPAASNATNSNRTASKSGRPCNLPGSLRRAA
jgi:hypothetical protein